MAKKVFGMEYVPAYNGDSDGLVQEFEEGSAQTFGAGSPVILSSGQVVQAVALNAVLGNVVLVGFALRAASGVQGTRLPVRIARPNDVYIVKMESDDTFAAADVELVGFELKRTSTGDVVVDKDTVSNPKVLILGTEEVNADGTKTPTAGGVVRVKIRNVAANIYGAV